MKWRVLIADDHFAIRSGLIHILQKRFPSAEFGEAVSAAEALKKLRGAKWDLLILDIELSGTNGLDLLKQISYEGLETQVLVFSFHNEQEIAIRAFRAGASGYLAKDAAGEVLFDAINQILAGRKYISSAVAQQLASQINSAGGQEPHQALSDREYQVMISIAAGYTLNEIAIKLSLSPSTISTYRSRILEKMELHSNADLTRYVAANKLQ